MSVRREENGTWRAQFWFRDYNGERRHKVRRGFETEEEAAEWEKSSKLDAEGSVSFTFAAFFEVYKKDMEPRLRESTWIGKEYMVRDKLLPTFGQMRMDEIESVDVIRWQNVLMAMRNSHGEPYSPTYLRTINNQLAAIFNHAVRFYGLRRSPCSRTTKLGTNKAGGMLFWTKGEYLRFADAVADKPDSFCAFEVLYWCGLRVGEMLALTPDDVDFVRAVVSVSKSYQRLKGRDVVTDPKTPKSVRTVAMPGFLADELSDWLQGHPVAHDGRMFPFTKDRMHHEMTRGCKATGVKRIRIHDLRHSHVSLLIDMGYSAVAIADRLGHESADVTFRYAHLFHDRQGEMARALDATRAGI